MHQTTTIPLQTTSARRTQLHPSPFNSDDIAKVEGMMPVQGKKRYGDDEIGQLVEGMYLHHRPRTSAMASSATLLAAALCWAASERWMCSRNRRARRESAAKASALGSVSARQRECRGGRHMWSRVYAQKSHLTPSAQSGREKPSQRPHLRHHRIRRGLLVRWQFGNQTRNPFWKTHSTLVPSSITSFWLGTRRRIWSFLWGCRTS